SAKITIAAQDGSKQKAVINVTVKQKVNDITVANAVNGELYFAVNEKDNAATTVKFTATPNADANTKTLAYSFALNPASWMGEDAAKAVALKGQNLTVSKEATAGLKAYFESENAPADGRVLVGTLTVTAKDNSKDGMPVAIQHIAKDVKVNVYAVAANKYVDQIEGGLAGLVANMIEGDVLTATTGQKNINLAAMLEIPADVTVRTVKWSVPKTSNAYLSVNAKGLMTIKNKLTEAGEQAEVYVQMTGADGKLLDPVALKVRIIASQKDFDNNLKGQIDTIIKENTYTWLGGKPTFNKAKGALTVAISDITMSKEAADAEMKAKLENIMEVFKTAAEAVIANTSTEYTSLTAVDSYTGKVWALNKVGSKVIVTVDGVQQGGEYDALNVSAAIKDLAGLITADIDELVEWAGKTLNVTLVADNTRNGQSTFTYTSNFTVNFTIKAADVQKYLDYKVGKAVDTFKAANEKVKDQTGIDNVVYDAAAGTVTLDLVDGNKVLADVYNLVKADAVATLEDLFVNAKTATVKVESPLLSADDKTEETFENNGQSVAEFVEKLYAHLPEEAVTTKNLEGTSIYATIVYNFSGTEYTKSYKVSFKRTLEAIDTDVDNRINAEVEKYEANELGALVYDAEANYLTVLVRDFDATFANARNHVNAVETTINAMIGDTFAKAAKVDTVEFANKTAETIKVTATDVLDIVMPEWAFESELSDLIGIEVPVTVYYKETVDTTTKEKVYSDALYYTVKFDMDMTVAEDAIEAAVKENVNAINAAEITTESIVLGADFSVATNTAVVVLNDEYLEKAPGELQSTGLYTMLVDVLNTAKANCAETVQVVYGEEATKAESLDAEISKKFVFELLGTLNINTLADFTKAPLEVYVTFTNKNVVSYVITFEAESILGAIESNPIMIQDMMFTQEVRAGKQVYFTGRIGGMILTVTGENAYVVYEGQRYDAVDGKVSVPMADNGFFYWPAFSIGNAGDETVVYNVAITYPAGHQMNPEVIEEVDVFANYYDGSLAANNTTGYFYTHTVAETGTMDFSFAEVTEGVVGDISVQNQNTYQMFTLDADGEEDMWGNKVLTVPVTAGDVLVINVVALPDANWNWPAMDYSMAVSFAYPLGTELNPVDLGFFEVPGTQYLEVEAGETVYFQSGAIGGTIMTLHDATGSAVVTYNSETYEIEDGKIELALAQSMFRQPIVFAVQNTGAVDRTYAVSFAYPVGTQMNPVEISDITGYAGYYDGSLAEGNTSGYYYTYTAEEAGTVSFWYAECTEGVVGDISVYNQNSYQMLTLDADGVEDMFGDKILTINVAAGDVLEVSVAALPDANWNWPAMEYSMAVLFEYPEGSEQNPVDLVVSNVPGTVKLTVPAGKTVYYQSNTLGGVQMTIAEATGCAVLHAGTTYEVENGRIDLVLTKPMMFMQPVVFAIQNKTTAEATYEVAFAYQAGTVENPEAVALGTTTCTLAEGNDCYYFQYTVATSGALTIDVSATEGGWQYCINNETQGVYGDTHWYDDETVVPTETINVTTGDVIRIMVGTYETGSWTNPAGTVKFTLSLE
ncbi:MAG: hypothetical protein IKL06_02185, partial [Lachnospiraceae bacterium]|nr:hypothetical protein [Lachnospiraceae bacterium]